MKYSEENKEIMAAYTKMWGELKTPEQNVKVDVYKQGKFLYTFHYTDLAGIHKAIKPPFVKYGLSYFQHVEVMDKMLTVYTRITHGESGQWVEGGLLTTTASTDMQALGSQITYLKRYSISGMLGLATERDDDGNAEKDQFANRVEQGGYERQDDKWGNNAQNAQNGSKGNQGTQQGAGNKNAAGGKAGGKNEQQKPPALITVKQKEKIYDKCKEIADTHNFPPEETWPRIQQAYYNPDLPPIPVIEKLSAKWADAVLPILEKHIQGQPLPPVKWAQQQNPPKGADQNEKAPTTGGEKQPSQT